METLFKLGPRGYRATVSNFKGKLRVHIQKYREENDRVVPTKDGIALNFEEWTNLTKVIKELDELIDEIIDNEDQQSQEMKQENQKSFTEHLNNKDSEMTDSPVIFCPFCKKTNFPNSDHCDVCYTPLRTLYQ